MGLRFQRRITLFPGVRLNFSRRGISTTIGPRGASITLGGRNGPALNLGIPGTGLSFRHQLTPPAPREPSVIVPTVDAPTALIGTEIRSADVSEVTSRGLGDLQTLYSEVVAEREKLRASINAARSRLSRAETRLHRARNWFFKLFVGGKTEERAAAVHRETAELKGLEEHLEGMFIDADFGLEEPAQAAFGEIVAAFKEVAACERLWDVTSSREQDRRATRSGFSTVVERRRVAFSVSDADDVIQTAEPVLRLGNANGPDLLMYPAFILLRSARDLAFVDLREVDVQFARVQFQEDESVPKDSQVVGHNWLRANKDGSPDRRFANNRQVPVALYGELSLTSPEGMNEKYMASNAATTEQLANALRAYQKTLPPVARETATVANTPTSATVRLGGRAVDYLRNASAGTPDQTAAALGRFSELLQADLATAQGNASLEEIDGLLTSASEVVPAVRVFLKRSAANAQLQALSEGFVRVVATFATGLRTALLRGRAAARGDDVARVDRLLEKASAIVASTGANPGAHT